MDKAPPKEVTLAPNQNDKKSDTRDAREDQWSWHIPNASQGAMQDAVLICALALLSLLTSSYV